MVVLSSSPANRHDVLHGIDMVLYYSEEVTWPDLLSGQPCANQGQLPCDG